MCGPLPAAACLTASPRSEIRSLAGSSEEPPLIHPELGGTGFFVTSAN